MSHLIQTSPARHARMIAEVAGSSQPGRSAVAASWRRSLVHHQLDPGNPSRPPRLNASQLGDRRLRAAALLQAAAPLMDRLSGCLLESGSAMLLADSEGVIVDERRCPGDESFFEDEGLASGTDWSEPSEGTNAIGTSLADGRSTVIWRDQHFFARNLPLICIGAPVEGADGTLAGVLNLSSTREDMSDIQGRLVTLAIQDAAIQASTALFHAGFPAARIVTLGTTPGAGPSLLAVDRDDLVIGANRAARRALDLSAQEVSRRLPLADLLEEPGAGGADLSRAMRSEVTRALRRCRGNITQASEELGISRATMYRKMKALGLTRSSGR